MGEEQIHKRRVRYKGTHPRKFSEKYKELNPEKYGDTIEKVISKGSTPAGMHIPIMVEEILDVLKVQPGDVGLDATLGYGGHSGKILEKLKGSGHLYSLDIDPIEIVRTEKRLRDKGFSEDVFTVIRTNFKNIDEVSGTAGKFDFLMADLGVSSMQIDNPERGFSYKNEGPLDLRLDPLKGEPASERLKKLTKDEFTGMLIENSDEPYAKEIATEVFNEFRKKKEINTTTDLYKAIEKALSFIPEKERKDAVKKSSQRTFQALRIDVNSEFEVLEEFLQKLPDVMKEGGRIAILTFHSGEDRLVKQYFKMYKRDGVLSEISDVIRPSAAECARNGRARSTKLRWAVR